jgi:hypothetical protein
MQRVIGFKSIALRFVLKVRRRKKSFPVHGMSSAVAATPLKGKLSARIAMAVAAAYAPMANRGIGAVIVVGPPDVFMANSAASVLNAEDEAYARMGK